MLVTQRHNDTQPNATGMLAPLMRGALHLGYVLGRAQAADDGWAAIMEEVKADLTDALAHMEHGFNTDHLVFVTPASVNLYQACKTDIEHLRDGLTDNRDEMVREMQRLHHNITYTVAHYEHDLTGETVHEGTAA